MVDAWFDVTTAGPGRDRWQAVAAAALVELPLAALSLSISYRAQRVIARTGAVRPARWLSRRMEWAERAVREALDEAAVDRRRNALVHKSDRSG